MTRHLCRTKADFKESILIKPLCKNQPIPGIQGSQTYRWVRKLTSYRPRNLRLSWEPWKERKSHKLIGIAGNVWWRVLGLASYLPEAFKSLRFFMKICSKANSKDLCGQSLFLLHLYIIIRPSLMRLDLFCKQISPTLSLIGVGSLYRETFYFNEKL